ncbi:uncharacterized protein SOCE26_071010 [Sorangium cellulosum]|uniref:Uncharacterized protein n=1 Tax=Sorangium cellulosum TaxID=56 RepID=A0A2L0F235_SORCE|nr:hypothetical protein [Sorangium cellulosum]AUX45606.1 uncharacterized protein SOCE26_071010 [Sorangium cellulosum]
MTAIFADSEELHEHAMQLGMSFHHASAQRRLRRRCADALGDVLEPTLRKGGVMCIACDSHGSGIVGIVGACVLR